jgi:hypothetical protein
MPLLLATGLWKNSMSSAVLLYYITQCIAMLVIYLMLDEQEPAHLVIQLAFVIWFSVWLSRTCNAVTTTILHFLFYCISLLLHMHTIVMWRVRPMHIFGCAGVIAWLTLEWHAFERHLSQSQSTTIILVYNRPLLQWSQFPLRFPSQATTTMLCAFHGEPCMRLLHYLC